MRDHAFGRRTVMAAAVAGLAGGLPACNGGITVPVLVTEGEMVAHVDVFQWAPAGAAGMPPAVLVRDAGGQPLRGVSVAFDVVAGDGILTGAAAVTGANGVAATTAWSLGGVTARNVVQATVAGLEPVHFTAIGMIGDSVAIQQVLSLQNQMTGLAEPTRILIRDRAAWAQAWAVIHVDHAPSQVPALPEIDFAADVVLLAGPGLVGAQGFYYTIERVRLHEGTLQVYVLQHWPTCGTLPAISAPVHAVRVPRVAEVASFAVVQRNDCTHAEPGS
jgi:hypothetical protein